MDLITLAAAKRYTEQQRLAYIEEETTPIFTDILVEADDFFSVVGVYPNIVAGETYIVTIDGVAKKYVCKYLSATGQAYIGNYSIYTSSQENTGEDFLIVVMRENVVRMYNARNEDISASCVLYSETIHPVDPKYIPALDSVTLNSPNGTQFKITVDDTGALTTTEVTT